MVTLLRIRVVVNISAQTGLLEELEAAEVVVGPAGCGQYAGERSRGKVSLGR
jgi:hypothetical protein